MRILAQNKIGRKDTTKIAYMQDFLKNNRLNAMK